MMQLPDRRLVSCIKGVQLPGFFLRESRMDMKSLLEFSMAAFSIKPIFVI